MKRHHWWTVPKVFFPRGLLRIFLLGVSLTWAGTSLYRAWRTHGYHCKKAHLMRTITTQKGQWRLLQETVQYCGQRSPYSPATQQKTEIFLNKLFSHLGTNHHMDNVQVRYSHAASRTPKDPLHPVEAHLTCTCTDDKGLWAFLEDLSQKLGGLVRFKEISVQQDLGGPGAPFLRCQVRCDILWAPSLSMPKKTPHQDNCPYVLASHCLFSGAEPPPQGGRDLGPTSRFCLQGIFYRPDTGLWIVWINGERLETASPTCRNGWKVTEVTEEDVVLTDPEGGPNLRLRLHWAH